MIQINAASRLKVLAKISEADARKYLTSLGVNVGDLSDNLFNSIDFEVEEPAKALTSLKKKLGEPKKAQKGTTTVYTFKADKGRSVVLTRTAAKSTSYIALLTNK